MLYFLPVAVPGVASKATTSSHARVPDVASSTVTLNILPSVMLVIVWRDTVASVESQILMCLYVITICEHVYLHMHSCFHHSKQASNTLFHFRAILRALHYPVFDNFYIVCIV